MVIEPEDLPFEVGGEKTAFGVRRRRSRNAVPDPVRQKRNKNNRRKGNKASLEWAKMVGGEHTAILGGEDVRQPFMLWEVKASQSLPSLGFIERALDQVAATAVLRHLPYGVALRIDGRPADRRWLVVLRGSSWLDLHYSGP